MYNNYQKMYTLFITTITYIHLGAILSSTASITVKIEKNYIDCTLKIIIIYSKVNCSQIKFKKQYFEYFSNSIKKMCDFPQMQNNIPETNLLQQTY